jgi:malate synthase
MSIGAGQGLMFPEAHWSETQELFPEELVGLVTRLHREFEPRRKALLERRHERQLEYDQGKLPDFLDRKSEAVTGKWKIAPLPEELLNRRVEITGPANSTKMVINMLMRHESGARADMAMLDFEDSMKPSYENVLAGHKNVIGAVAGNLSWSSPTGKFYKLDPNDMAYVMVRCRGLHLNETNIKVDGVPVSAGLLDLTVCFYHTAKLYLKQGKTPKYYVPKCEHFMEARWWSDLFTALEEHQHLPVGTLRATFLIETLPATFQVEEILYEIREHAAGLNVGRWDKIFSDIKVLRQHPDRIMADRASITMTRPWMENYAKRVIKICHERGAFAMGGMSAFTPGKTPESRSEQTKRVAEDKAREVAWGHDGCWVSHPYFIQVAMNAFTRVNQLERTLPEFDKYSNVLPVGEGPHTLHGLRTNVRVGIAFLHGWNKDIGCLAFDDLMEDLATLEISRAQSWQWLHHGITLDSGEKVEWRLMRRIFDEECEKIIAEFGDEERTSLEEARDKARELYMSEQLADFLCLDSEPVQPQKGNDHERPSSRAESTMERGASF